MRVDVVALPGEGGDSPALEFAIVRVRTDDGIVGLGEASAPPSVVRAVIEAPAWGVLSHGIVDLLVGRDPREVATLWEDLYRLTLYAGHRGAYLHAISAIDIALWDILGKSTGLPVHTLLGGAFADVLPAYLTALMPSEPDAAQRVAEEAVADGWGALKLGWLPQRDAAADAELVMAARRGAGPDVALMIDVGTSAREQHGSLRAVAPWDFRTALARIRSWDSAELSWVEEPLPADDLDGYRRLVDASETPIAAGEQETTRFGLYALMDRGGVDVVQCDVARVGGLTEARRVVQAAADRNRRFAPHCYGSGIQLAASAHLAASAPNLARLEYPAPVAHGPSLVHPGIEAVAGSVALPQGPGLGVELDEELLEHLRVR
ncbi:MAG: mandelate racemase/muconate lactonizing enzyme family protein [Solirubrobacteraceae bacterium]